MSLKDQLVKLTKAKQEANRQLAQAEFEKEKEKLTLRLTEYANNGDTSATVKELSTAAKDWLKKQGLVISRSGFGVPYTISWDWEE